MSAAGGGVVFTISANAEQVVAASQQGQQALRDLSAAYQQQAQIINTVADAYRLMGAAQADAYSVLLQGAAGTENYGATLDAVRGQMGLFRAEQNESNIALEDWKSGVVSLQGMDGPLGGLGNMLSNLTPLMGALTSSSSDASDVFETLATGALGAMSGAIGGVTDAIGGFITQMAAMAAGMEVFQLFGEAAQEVQSLADEMMQLNMTMQSQDVGWAYLFGGAGAGPGGTTGPNYDASSQLMAWTAVQSYNMPYTRQDMNQAISTLQTTGLNEAGIEQVLPFLSDLGVRNPQLDLAQIAQSVMGAEFGYTRMLRYDLKITPQQLQQYGLAMNGTSIDPSTLLPALQNYAEAQGYYKPVYDTAGNVIGDQGSSYYMAHNTLQGAMTSWTDRYQNALLQLGGTYYDDATNPLYNQSDVDAVRAGYTRVGRYDPAAVTTADQANQHVADLQAQIAKDAANSAQLATDQQQLQQYLAQFGGGTWVRDPQYNPADPAHSQVYMQKAFGQAGDVSKGSIFDDLITALNTITTWWDTHQPDLNKLVDLFSSGIGQGAKDAGVAIQGLLDGLQKTGAGNDALKAVQGAIGWLSDPKNIANIRDMASAVGTDLGVALKTAGDDFGSLKNDVQEVANVFGAGNLTTDIYTLGAAFLQVNQWVETFAAGLSLVMRIFVDLANAYRDIALGDFTDAGTALSDMQQAWTDWSNSVQQINSQTAQSFQQLAQAMQQQQQAAAAQTNNAPAAGPGVQSSPGSASGVKPYTPPSAPSTGPNGYGSISYGGSTTTVIINGASGSQVQAIVDGSAAKKAQASVTQAKRPGGPRFGRLGMIY